MQPEEGRSQPQQAGTLHIFKDCSSMDCQDIFWQSHGRRAAQAADKNRSGMIGWLAWA